MAINICHKLIFVSQIKWDDLFTDILISACQFKGGNDNKKANWYVNSREVIDIKLNSR